MPTNFKPPVLAARSPLLDPRRLRICVFGASGSGKTTFGSQFPRHIFFDLDAGAEAVSIRPFPAEVPADFEAHCRAQKPPITPSRWSWLKYGIGAAIESGEGEALIIDTIDAACDLAFDHVCAEFGITHPDDRPSQKAQMWGRINREIEGLLKSTRAHSGAVVFISHETQRDYDPEGNAIGMFDKSTRDVRTRYIPSLRERPRVALEKVCSIIGRAYIDDQGARWLYIGTNPKFSTKLRIPPSVADLFEDRIPLGYDALLEPFRAAYKKLNSDP